MKKNLRDTLFGFRTERSAEAFAELKAAPKVAPTFNEEGTTLFKRRAPRVIGLTEQRLRARNKRSWITDGKVWRRLFARITPGRAAVTRD